MESLYDYGIRAGFWRIMRLLKEKQAPATVYGCGMAYERSPDCVAAMVREGWEVSSHGYRWIDYQDVPEDEEREDIRKTVEIHERMVGHKPTGIYQGKPNVNTRKLVVEAGFMYDNDAYDDDLPHWDTSFGKPHLVIPYTLDCNDMRFNISHGYSHAVEFFNYLKDAFDVLLAEGNAGQPKMMTIGLHCRIVGRPSKSKGLEMFLDYVNTKRKDVWIARRDEIASYWYKNHYPEGHGKAPEVPVVGRMQASL
jgi:peptidoglycan/xylan/chitin deacetylase (PgdA/CDA1 family)